MIRRPDEFQNDFEVECDVVVVGAGPGGSAAAYKLAKLGRKVIVLEAGGSFTPGDFGRDGIKALKNLYQDAGQRFTRGNAFFTTMFGKGVGGGSLVNSGISFRPPERSLARWNEEARLTDVSLHSLAPYLDEVEKNVNIEILDMGRLGRNNTIFKEGLEKLSYKGGIVPRNTKNCQACGRCFFGCPSGAKQSTDKNFIADAMSRGVDVYTYARVARLDVDRKRGIFESLMAVIHDAGTGQPRARMTVKAKHLVLSAGAVGTPQILLAAKIANSSGQVGRNFRCHPSVGALGVFEEKIEGFKSVMQGYYSDQFFESDEILLETFWAPAGIIATFIPGFGIDATNDMMNISHFAGSGGMIRDTSSGTLTFNGQKVEIEYSLNLADQRRLTEALYRSCEVLFAAGAKAVYADNPKKGIFSNWSELRDFFVSNKNLGPDIVREGNHGMGTCRMGEDSSTSVVNSHGRSHDIKNLSVLDVSIFPGALGVNPQITIMALALRGAEYLDGHFS